MEPHVNLLNTTSVVVCYSIWRVAIVAEVSSFNLNLVCAEETRDGVVLLCGEAAYN